MRLRYFRLRSFPAVARDEHTGRAAEELRGARPSPGRADARPEAEPGAPLFDRWGRRIRRNRRGATFLRQVERTLSELDDGRGELRGTRDHVPGRVSVAAETLPAIGEPLGGFRAARPRAGVRLCRSTAEERGRQLRAE
ncbi:hypothetical protein [Streptomyces sp. GS7]|uniref:hypothetical protein n=1 Tax=Streptomyces sp. GS7 TaxID=2692234 RepID=UPI0013164194|nr:hypothetical protein [Streptomyces sp. GS7]QHC24497.1 hypothetical protein GR130_27120 [Streptomyces sp. GS7]